MSFVDLLLCLFVSLSCVDHRDLRELTHTFPSRRSSDLSAGRTPSPAAAVPDRPRSRPRRAGIRPAGTRSEVHTSELQSLMRNSYAVRCLKNKMIVSYPLCILPIL